MSIDIRYMAGMVDADGCLSINFSGSNKTGTPVLTVTSTNMKLVNKIQSRYGGGISMRIHPNKKASICYNWRLCSKNAISLIKRISKYLIVKKPQADLLLSKESFDRKDKAKMHKFNKRGIDV